MLCSFRSIASALVPATLLATLLLPAPAGAAVMTGRVTHVHDGGTLDVMVGGKRLRLRLAGIDPPRAGQAYSLRSRQSLVAICGGEVAAIDPAGRDGSGMMLAQVNCSGVDAGREQVRLGMARVHAHPGGGTESALRALEHEARTARRGLWSSMLAKE